MANSLLRTRKVGSPHASTSCASGRARQILRRRVRGRGGMGESGERSVGCRVSGTGYGSHAKDAGCKRTVTLAGDIGVPWFSGGAPGPRHLAPDTRHPPPMLSTLYSLLPRTGRTRRAYGVAAGVELQREVGASHLDDQILERLGPV